MLNIAPLLAGTLLAFTAWPSFAQGVFKCSVDGQTVYQAAPCNGQGKKVAIEAGPSEQQIREAQQRASSDMARAQAQRQEATQAPQFRDKFAPPKYDCAKLNQQRAEAFGRRNGALHAGRGSNVDTSQGVNDAHSQIIAIESKMRAGGCAPT